MENLKASIYCAESNYFIKIMHSDGEISIPMSDENQNEVKSAFNKIISLLRTGEYHIELESVGEDLFSQVAKEYITQLNREIKEVYTEMEQLGLLSE